MSLENVVNYYIFLHYYHTNVISINIVIFYKYKKGCGFLVEIWKSLSYFITHYNDSLYQKRKSRNSSITSS
jgi:hypothetical protein